MGLFNRIFGGRGWDNLPTKFVEVLKTRLGEHLFKVLDSLVNRHNILDIKIFQDPPASYLQFRFSN